MDLIQLLEKAHKALENDFIRPTPTRHFEMNDGKVMVKYTDGTWHDHSFMFSKSELDYFRKELKDDTTAKSLWAICFK